MSALVFLLEEMSAEKMLRHIVPKLVPEDISVQYIVFNGKTDLKKQIVKKLKYWIEPCSYFIIIHDQDSCDCHILKQKLLKLVNDSGRKDTCLVRIACHELESFYLGDLEAVAHGLQIPTIAKKQNKNPYRNPDNIANAAEQLEKITDGKYRKVSGSDSIGKYLKLDGSNKSKSFGALINAIQRQVECIAVSVQSSAPEKPLDRR